MTRVFVDTSAFVALRNRREQEHRVARTALERLLDERASLFTSTAVFGESYTALLVRVGRAEAIAWGRQMRDGTLIEIVPIDEDIRNASWDLLEQHEDKAWSHVDATSFALMEREGSTTAFCFDRRFGQRGLTVVPEATASR